jgi:hypothetical protein
MMAAQGKNLPLTRGHILDPFLDGLLKLMSAQGMVCTPYTRCGIFDDVVISTTGVFSSLNLIQGSIPNRAKQVRSQATYVVYSITPFPQDDESVLYNVLGLTPRGDIRHRIIT